jgi:hypothetical protein
VPYKILALPLFVPGIGADDPDDAAAPDDLAMLAKFLDGCANFHCAEYFFV